MARINTPPPRTNFTLTAKLCQNWNIADVRHSLPRQLRPRGNERVAPSVVALLFELSKATKGEVYLVQRRLRRAVLKRLEKSKHAEKRGVTEADVRDVLRWFQGRKRRLTGKEKGARASKKGKERRSVGIRNGDVGMLRRSARFAPDNQDTGSFLILPDVQITDAEHYDPRPIDVDGTSESETDSASEMDGSEVVIADSPPISPRRDSTDRSWSMLGDDDELPSTNRCSDLDDYLRHHRLQDLFPPQPECGTDAMRTRLLLARLIQLREGNARRSAGGVPYTTRAEPHKTEVQRLEEALGRQPDIGDV